MRCFQTTARSPPPLLLAGCLALAAVVPPAASVATAAADAPAGVPKELAAQELPRPVLEALRAALGVYDEVRGELAADRLEGLPATTSRLADALRIALEDRSGLGEAVCAVVEEAARTALALKQAENLEAARLTFGELSRLLVLLGGSDPRLAEGFHVFTCPMAPDFSKWIQVAETMANPYMGQAMLLCGGPTEWSVPAPSPAVEEREPAQASGPEPVLEPGIPGLRMEDVRDQKFLWREIEELQRWERSDRISIAEFRSKAVEKTAHFLGFHGAAADDFAGVAFDAIAGVRDSFRRERDAGIDPSGLDSPFSADLSRAVSRIGSLLGDAPRHQLFAPDCKKWLLKLAFSPREGEERQGR